MSFDNSIRGDAATVHLNVSDGQFRADIAEDERLWRSTVANMSRESLRLSLAQERLRVALSKYGAESAQVKRATIALKDAEESAGRTAQTTGRRFASARSELERTTRGAVSGSGALRGLGRSLAFASASFLGGAGFVFALRKTIDTAREAEVAEGKLSVAARNQGIAWGQNRTQVLAALQAQSRMSAFNRTELTTSLAQAVTRTGDLNAALRLNADAADVARGTGRSLASAMTLITRASLGQVGSLRRLGLDVSKVSTEQDKLARSGVHATFAQREHAKALDLAATKLSVLAQVEKYFGGQAEKYAHSAQGAQDRFNASLHESEIIIGNALLPTLTKYLQQGADWLDQMNKSGKLQKDVNDIVHTATGIVQGFGAAIHVATQILKPFVGAVGGAKNAAELFAAAFAAYKLAKIAAGIRGLSIAFGLVGTRATVAAAEAVTAENAIGTAAVVNAGKVGILSRALGGLGGLAGLAGTAAVVAGTVAVADIVAILSVPGAGGARTDHYKRYPNVMTFLWRVDHGVKLSPEELRIAKALGNRSPSSLSDQQLKALDKALSVIYGTDPASRAGGTAHPQGRRPPSRTRGGGGGGPPPPGGGGRTEQDIQTDISRAAAHQDVAAQEQYLHELDALYKRRIAALEAVHHKSQLQQQQLQQLYDQQASTEGQIQSLEQDAATKSAAAKRKATEALKKKQAEALDKEHRKEQALIDAKDRAAKSATLSDDKKRLLALVAFYREQSKNDALSVKARKDFAEKRRKAQAELDALPAKALRQRITSREADLQNQLLADEVKKNVAAEKRDYEALIAFYRRLSKDMDLTKAERQRFKRKMLEEEKREQSAVGGKKGAGTPFDAASFLSELQGTLNTYGGDLFGPGDLKVGGGDPHSRIHTEILRDVNRNVKRLGDAARNPGSRYGYRVLTSALDDRYSY